MNRQTTVAVVVTRPETVLADYARLLDLAGVTAPRDTAEGRRWCLVTAPLPVRSGPAAACPPWQLEGVVRALLGAGNHPDDIAFAAAAAVDADRERQPLRGWSRVLRGCGIEGGLVAPEQIGSAGARLVLANLRTDGALGLAGAAAAHAAWLAGGAQALSSRGGAAELEAAWRGAAATLAGAVVDATVAGDGSRESTLVPVAAHTLLAGRDPVAVDAVACGLAGLDPRHVPLLAQLGRARLGCADPGAIDLVGDTAAMPASLDLMAARRFRAGSAASGPRWWRRWTLALADRWPRPLLQRRARRRYESQPWGRLHAEYDRRGIIGGGEP